MRKVLVSKSECRFDHIFAYAKGGKSTLDNCQIFCEGCNLSKSDKEMNDFILEEKAGAFINKHKDIKKVDFTRDKNNLPSVAYVTKYYGTMNELKLAFGLEIDTVWNRENIWQRLLEYSEINPEFKQAELTKVNKLPSLPCVLSYFPEYKNFSDIKIALGLDLNYELWTKEKIVDACRRYLKTHSKITLKDLRKENGLPTSKVIYRFYDTMQDFQKDIGSEVSKIQEFISKEELMKAIQELIQKNGSTFESRALFLEMFPYSQSVIINRYGSFDSFMKEANITILNTKKRNILNRKWMTLFFHI